jgi:exopolysaccharide biosynthesis polyprenyl glycosylphosphotransferase
MLGFSEADTSVRPETDREPTRDASLTVLPSRLEVAPQRRASQDQRRAIGLLLIATSVAVETAIVLFWMRTIVHIGATGAPRFFAVVYVATAMALLLPTYRRGRLVPRPAELFVQVTTRLALAPILTAILTLASQRPLLEYLDMRSYVFLVLATVGSVMIARLVMFKISQLARARGYDLEDTLIVGAGPVGVGVAQVLEDNFEFGLVPYGFVDRFEEHLPYPIVGRPEDLLTILEDTKVRHVVLAFGAASEVELVSYIRNCSVLPVQFYAVPRFFELGVSTGSMGREVDGFALMPMRRAGQGHSMWPAKRAFDLVVSSLLLFLTAPLMLVCAAAVKLSSAGPVFFKQVRVGVGGVPFEMYKFRSMRVNDDHHTTWSVDDDQRVTKVGAFLRKTHLDELPQLINVLRGDMSIVGPRPERPYFVEQFSTEIDGYSERHRVPSGITGWAQVNGFWGDTSIEARVRLDNRYIENWSLWRDLVIAMRTVPTLLGKRR